MNQACRSGREICKSIPSELSMLQEVTERRGKTDIGRKLYLLLSC